MICKICQQEVKEEKHFWFVHRIKLDSYIEEYESRFDLQTGEPIPFKSNLENYLLTDFINKNNLKAYLKEGGDRAVQYCREFLKKRKKIKELNYAPCQVELKSLVAPTIITYEKLFAGYNGLCRELGLEDRFDILDHIPPYCLTPGHMIIDTREQKPLLDKDIPAQVEKLDFGDYSFSKNLYHIYIERKSLTDLLGTISTGYERFQRELSRAKEAGAFLIIMVESPISDALSFNYLPYIARNVKATPDFIWHRIRELLQSYNNIQFIFTKGREDCRELLKKIYFCPVNLSRYDLQLAREMKFI